MATPTFNHEDEIKILKEQNTELVQKVQHWKMLAAQRENEKLDLMKELNEMRLKLARLRSNGDVQASKLDTALQSASEKALAHLVRASGEIARTIDLAKTYMRERNEMDTVSPRWSAIGGTPYKTEKVHRVPPMMIGGQSIQPVVSLSRTLLNTSNTRPAARSPNQNRNVTERAVPMHMLQDVYIPLTRIDASEHVQSMETEVEVNNSEDSAEELEESGDGSDAEESQQMSEDEFNTSRRLDAVVEDMEPENEIETPPRNTRSENPLEGPSWLLDAISTSTRKARRNLEPDSTTEVDEAQEVTTPVNISTRREDNDGGSRRVSREFSPTVRRRKRASGRHEQYSPRALHSRRISNSGRVLKVMVAKMRLEVPPSPPRSPAPAHVPGDLSHAPSPNGATVPGVIVSMASLGEQGGSGDPHSTPQEGHSQRAARVSRAVDQEQASGDTTQDSRCGSRGSRDSDSGSGTESVCTGRSRRARNKVTNYQERSLRGKLRR